MHDVPYPSMPTSQEEWECHVAFARLAEKESAYYRRIAERLEKELSEARQAMGVTDNESNGYLAIIERHTQRIRQLEQALGASGLPIPTEGAVEARS